MQEGQKPEEITIVTPKPVNLPRVILLGSYLRATAGPEKDQIMDLEKLWRQLQALPPEEQRQVADFISFLSTRYYRLGLRQRLTKSQLVDEAFVGLWQDREDLADSTSWVRHVRQQEWGS